MSLNLAPLTLEPLTPQPIAQPASVHGHSQVAQSSSPSYHLRNTFPINVLQCISGYLDDPTRALLIREGELPSAHTITKIVDTSHKILWKLPQGRPDYSAPYEEIDGQHLHFRTLYQQADGFSCWLEVFQHILHGAHPAKVIPQEKSIDTLLQELNYTDEEIASQDFIDLLSMPTEDTQAKRKAFLKLNRSFDKMLYFKVMNEFNITSKSSNSKMSFSEYVTERIVKRQLQVFDKFFKKNHIQALDLIPQPLYDAITNTRSIMNEGVKNLPLTVQKAVATALGVNAVVRFYQFPASSWNTVKHISHLLEEVRMHGAIGFGGKFGTDEYTETPQPVLKIEGHTIFGWRAGTRKADNNYVGHYIVVVGVIQERRKEKIEQDKMGYVIYIDPQDKSDPKDPEQQKFYLITYETFKQSVANNCTIIPYENFKRSGYVDYSKFLPKFENQLLGPIAESSPSKEKPIAAAINSLVFGNLPNPPYVKVEGKKKAS